MPRDAVVVGSGPNGLAAAITLAEAGWSVLVLEAAATVGGGTRSAELTLPGFVHDVCSAIHPMGVASPFFIARPLESHGLRWIVPPAAVAHPLDDGTAVLLDRSIAATAASLGPDGQAYGRLLEPVIADWGKLAPCLLGPARPPRHPLTLARFGMHGLQSVTSLAGRHFRGERARALFAGLGAHSVLPLDAPLTASFALILGALGHIVGWPLPEGGSQRIADAMAAHLRSLGGDVVTGIRVDQLDQLEARHAILLDLTPRQVVRVAGQQLSAGYRSRLERYRYGPAAFKVDYALDGPVPWTARECRRAATVHLGGTMEEIAASEAAVWRGEHPKRPFVLSAQQSLFDQSRAPSGKHTLWAYCHVPNGSTVDMSARIEAQIERFAPGFKERILARSVYTPALLEGYNANYVGGDIIGGIQDWRQFFARPAARIVPYTTPAKGLYLCSASTPPGAGVHGMCGYYAARAALRGGFWY